MQSRRFPKFGHELERGFPVHETCYDCVEFYNGCNAWPENKAFQCADYYPLPSVMPGTCGQVFPPSGMEGRTEPKVRREVAADGHEDFLVPSPAPTSKQRVPSHARPRLCECGAALSKGKRFCESCRVQRRRQTMCDYMRSRRAARPESKQVSELPLFATARHPPHASSGDLPLTGLPSGGARSEQTSV